MMHAGKTRGDVKVIGPKMGCPRKGTTSKSGGLREEREQLAPIPGGGGTKQTWETFYRGKPNRIEGLCLFRENGGGVTTPQSK